MNGLFKCVLVFKFLPHKDFIHSSKHLFGKFKNDLWYEYDQLVLVLLNQIVNDLFISLQINVFVCCFIG